MFGDFNKIRQLTEREGQGINDEEGTMEFNSMIETTKLNELPTTRELFTWSNKNAGSRFVRSRLDYILVNDEWLSR